MAQPRHASDSIHFRVATDGYSAVDALATEGPGKLHFMHLLLYKLYTSRIWTHGVLYLINAWRVEAYSKAAIHVDSRQTV